MAQNLRDTLSNRRFAIPLIALLGICFVGLLLLGIVLILPGLRDDSGQVAQEATPEAEVEQRRVRNCRGRVYRCPCRE